MTFTRHGHQITGTTAEVRPPGMEVARCGGEMLCGHCQRDAAKARQGSPTNTGVFDTSGMLEVNETDMQAKAKQLVFDYVREHMEVTEQARRIFSIDDVFVVWWCKTLQNWKALISTSLPDGMYYELTYNGDKKETYFDAYKKFQHVKIAD